MPRLILAALLLLSSVSAVAAAAPASDPFAVTLAQQSVAALTGGAQVSDVTLNGKVISILGSDYETGTGTLQAKGISESRVDLNLSGGIRSDVRSSPSGTAGGAWAKDGNASTSYSSFNCLTDAAWFFPALSSLSQTSNPNFVFKYVGMELHGGVNTQHLRVFQASAGGISLFQHLSTIDFYLDPASFLPLAIAFPVHPDLDAGTDLPAEIQFAQYQSVNGIAVPFHIQRMLNGGVILDITVTNATLNTGVLDSIFSLQ